MRILGVAAMVSVIAAVPPNSQYAHDVLTVHQPRAEPSQSVPFKVAGRWQTALCLLVSPATTDQQLTALINDFRRARASGTLGRLLPATTPRGSKGPFGIVQVFVLSDSKAANSGRLTDFIHTSIAAETPSQRDFGKRIRAYYYYTALGDREIGSIGHENGQRSANYKKLF